MRKRQSLNSLDEEIRDHVERETQENVDRGMSRDDARYAALRKFGNVTSAKEDARAVFMPVWLDQLLQDTGYAFRTLRRSPAFGAIAILTLSGGIGMAVTVFSVFNAVLLRPLSYPDANRLIWVSTYGSHLPPGVELVTSPDFLEWQERATSFDGMIGYDTADETLAIANDAARARIANVSTDFWKLSGVQPALGRLPAPDEHGTVVLSHGFFEQWLHSDVSAIGRAVNLGRSQVTITGVLPKGFRFQLPSTTGPDVQSTFRIKEVDGYRQMFLPPRSSAFAQLLSVVVRLKPNVTIDRAQAELEEIRGAQNTSPFASAARLRVLPLQDRLVGEARVALQVLLFAVGFVLLIACANLASLLLARASTRQKETAIRAAVGAGRARLVRQALAESLVLAVCGWAVGLLFAKIGIGLIVRLGPNAVPRLAETTIDGRVIAFSLGAALVAISVFGLTSAFALWAASPQDVLKDGGRTSAAPAGGIRVRAFLVAAELSLAMVLLTGAGLMLKSFWRMYTYPAGFDPGRVLTMSVDYPGPDFSEPPDRIAAQGLRQRTYVGTLLQRVQASPGVEAASITTHGESLLGNLTVEGASPAGREEAEPPVLLNATTAAFASVMGLRVVSGRWITTTEPQPVVVLNEMLARRLFGHDNPVGRRLVTAASPLGTVVGVVADLRYARLDENPKPELYVPYSQLPGLYRVNLVIRTAGDALALAPAVRKIVSGTDATHAPYDVMTLEQALASSILPRRFNLFLLVSFAASALSLALIGVYGVVTYSVTQRTHEIGVRMTLGAQPGDVIRLVVGHGARMALVGASVGLLAAAGLTRQIAGLLYDVQPMDPYIFALVATVLVVAALLACSVPAAKAVRVDPVIALRYE
jgi:putative ABC transport system permease protein